MKPISSPYPRPPLLAPPVHPIIRWTDQTCLICLVTFSLLAVAQFLIKLFTVTPGAKVELGWTGVVGFILNTWFLVLCMKKKSPRERAVQRRLCIALLVFWPVSLVSNNSIGVSGLLLFAAVLGGFVWRAMAHIERKTLPANVSLDSMINPT